MSRKGEEVLSKVYLFKAAPEEELYTPTGGDKEGGTNTTDVYTKDRFITLLTNSQLDTQLVPVLVFEYSNLESLWRHLKHPAQHAGIIFTSPRCVQSLVEAIKVHDSEDKEWEKGLRNAWESKFIFCVGPSTVSTAKQLLPSLKAHLVITGLESHAESLANKIIEVNSKEAFNASLLYPCGVQRRDVLLNKLNGESVSCNECIVYESVKNPALETTLNLVAEELKDYHSSDGKETVLCFFSPSGVKHVFQHLDPKLIDHRQANIVAIGPTTKTALEDYLSENGIEKRIYQCKNPTPEALLDAIMSLKSESS